MHVKPLRGSNALVFMITINRITPSVWSERQTQTKTLLNELLPSDLT